jgi:cytochrome c oxidase subunit 2
MALLFVGWSCFFIYTLWRFHRSRNPKANYHGVTSHTSTHLEFSVILIEATLLLGFAIPLWGKRTNGDQFTDNPDAIRVHVVAEQFAWNFHYPGPDGVFGKPKPGGGNPLDLDPNDEAGKDDLITRNEVHVVNKRPVVFEITSKDVIHSMALKNMRMTQDAIPGTRVPMWFRPIRSGEFEVICAQLCGSGHTAMRALLKVDSQADYDAWVKETTQLQHPVAAPPAAAAPAAAAPAAK